MIYEWVKSLLGSKPFLLGVNGPQGSGKTTLTNSLCERLRREGMRAISISIDDFYLTRKEQVSLAASGNPFWQARGYPGTHDVELGVRVLKSLKAGEATSIPRYYKSAHGGKGDRSPLVTLVTEPLHIIFLEGWMLGFSAAPTFDPFFAPINEALGRYQAWHSRLDGFLQLVPQDYRFVLDWRVEAEEKMKAAGKPGMSPDEIRAYVETFLPAYELYLPWLAEHPPVKANLLQVKIGKDRAPI